MKSQDLLILLKLVSLNRDEQQFRSRILPRQGYLKSSWEGWDSIEGGDSLLEGDLGVSLNAELTVQRYSVRSLAASTGIGKTEVNNSIKRMTRVGLARMDRKTGLPKANTKALVDLIIHSVRYVFPAEMGIVTRGIPTAFSAPVLASELSYPGELVPVWPDPFGKTKGQAVEPLYKSVPHAVRRDPFLYSLLALTDAMRIGGVREITMAAEQLRMETKDL